jgi:uncharacterized membrane protein
MALLTRVSRDLSFVLVALIALISPAALAQPITPRFVEIGDLPGGGGGDPDLGRAFGISADGAVAVGQGFGSSGLEAFRWTDPNGPLVGLGDLAGGAFASVLRGISADGSVAAGAGSAGASPQAMRWTSGGLVALDDLPGGAGISAADGISNDGGLIVGFASSTSGQAATRWSDANSPEGLGDLGGGLFESRAFATSADGSIIVGYGTSAAGRAAVRWTDPNAFLELDDLPGGINRSEARAITPDGSIIVGLGHSVSGQQALRWLDANSPVGLGDLAGGTFKSVATDVSADGAVVVGWSATGADPNAIAGDRTAFVWIEGVGMRRLENILINLGLGADIAGWHLEQVRAISDDGHAIVGYGQFSGGGTRAFLAVIPEPSTWLLLAAGLAALGWLRRV